MELRFELTTDAERTSQVTALRSPGAQFDTPARWQYLAAAVILLIAAWLYFDRDGSTRGMDQTGVTWVQPRTVSGGADGNNVTHHISASHGSPRLSAS